MQGKDTVHSIVVLAEGFILIERLYICTTHDKNVLLSTYNKITLYIYNLCTFHDRIGQQTERNNGTRRGGGTPAGGRQ